MSAEKGNDDEKKDGHGMPSKPKTERHKLFYQRELCDPKEWLNFVQLDPFTPAWDDLGLSDDDLRLLEIAICTWPDKPPVISGTGGCRKLRFAPESWNRGKSGAVRVYYAYFPEYGLVALIFAHDKDNMEEITDRQKRQIKALIEEIQTFLDSR